MLPFRYRLAHSTWRSFVPVLLLFAPFLLGACEEDSSEDEVSEATVYYLYSYSVNDNKVTGFLIDADSGDLSELPGSPYSAINGTSRIMARADLGAFFFERYPFSSLLVKHLDADSGALETIEGGLQTANPNAASSRLALHPTQPFLYATDTSNAELHGHKIDTDTLDLSAITGSPFSAPGIQQMVAMDAQGRFLQAMPGGDFNVYCYKINSSTGALTPTSNPVYSLGATTFAIYPDPLGQYVFIVDNGGSIYAVNVGQTSGNLSDGNAVNTGNYVYTVQVHPSGNAVYIGTDAGLFTYKFDRSTGDYTEFPDSPYYTSEVFDVAFTPDGKYAILTDSLVGSLYVRETDADGGLADTAAQSVDTTSVASSILVVDPAAGE